MNTLTDLLDHSLNLPPEYGGGLSSHLPMALHALHALGANESRMRAFHAASLPRFEPLARGAEVEPVADWRAALGHFDSFAALRSRFAGLLAERGLDDTLAAVLPALWPGAAGAAFHGLIRSAHAVQTGHAGEIAAALAYWAARFQRLPGSAPGAEPMPDWGPAVEAAALRTRHAGSMISDRILLAAGSDDYRRLSSGPPGASLQVLSDWAVSLYLRSGNFTVLHLVTGMRAARVLMPWTADAVAVQRGLAGAVTAATLASNLLLNTVPKPVAPRQIPNWQAVRDAAIASDDAHVIKLVHACFEDAAAHGEGERLAAAARATGLLG